jgi:asparagine synthase (glutamine-hydrolysing)
VVHHAHLRIGARELVGDLFSTRLRQHAGFYGEMIWVLMMLEHWLQNHAPSFSLD